MVGLRQRGSIDRRGVQADLASQHSVLRLDVQPLCTSGADGLLLHIAAVQGALGGCLPPVSCDSGCLCTCISAFTTADFL